MTMVGNVTVLNDASTLGKLIELVHDKDASLAMLKDLVDARTEAEGAALKFQESMAAAAQKMTDAEKAEQSAKRAQHEACDVQMQLTAEREEFDRHATREKANIAVAKDDLAKKGSAIINRQAELDGHKADVLEREERIAAREKAAQEMHDKAAKTIKGLRAQFPSE